jgi:hypothetical protein
VTICVPGGSARFVTVTVYVPSTSGVNSGFCVPRRRVSRSTRRDRARCPVVHTDRRIRVVVETVVVFVNVILAVQDTGTPTGTL